MWVKWLVYEICIISVANKSNYKSENAERIPYYVDIVTVSTIFIPMSILFRLYGKLIYTL